MRRRQDAQGAAALLVVMLMAGVVGAYVSEDTITDDARSTFLITAFGFEAYGAHHGVVGFYVYITHNEHSHYFDRYHGPCPLIYREPTPTDRVVKHNVTTLPMDWVLDCSLPGLYHIFFINCLGQSVSFQLRLIEYNVHDGHVSYLPVGEAPLPLLYAALTGVYVLLSLLWAVRVMRDTGAAVTSLHYVMTAALFLHTLSLFARAVELKIISLTGSAGGWNIAYYLFGASQGVLTFVAIVLIGTGYHYFKSFLTPRDKRLLLAVLPLQLVAHVAQIAASEGNLGSLAFLTWRRLFALLDLLSAGLVLVPIALSIDFLKASATSDGKAAASVTMLALFRRFYVLVFTYLYFTRIIVTLLEWTLSFRYEWLALLFSELAALAFYLAVGFHFRPTSDNTYLALLLSAHEHEAVELNDMPHLPRVSSSARLHVAESAD